jgi:serine/threonine-protein kinase
MAWVPTSLTACFPDGVVGIDLHEAPRSPILPRELFASVDARAPDSVRLLSMAETSPSSAIDGAASRRLQPGTLLDRYRVEREIGIGGFGSVYLATHIILRSAFALKVLKPDFRKQDSMLARLQREGKLAAMIHHDNVVRVFDAMEHPDIAYLVLEYVEGGSLADRLKAEHCLPTGQALRIGLDVTRGLAAAAAAGVIHRDIKPANILLGRSGAKITDFGLAFLQVPGTKAARVGTPGYASPEQASQGVVDHRADIFSLGVTLLETITGIGPRKFHKTSVRSSLPELPPLSAWSAHVDDDVARLIASMVVEDPGRRLGSYAELERNLLELVRKFENNHG